MFVSDHPSPNVLATVFGFPFENPDDVRAFASALSIFAFANKFPRRLVNEEVVKPITASPRRSFVVDVFMVFALISR